MYELPGSPPDHAEPQPTQQAAEPGEGEQSDSPKHTEERCDTTHHMHSALCGDTNSEFMQNKNKTITIQRSMFP